MKTARERAVGVFDNPPAGFRPPACALLATVASLVFSRWVFQRALESYRSAGS
ncbi:MAG: hypothetical protein ABR915_15005 [Thermoguttaceae bacterium]